MRGLATLLLATVAASAAFGQEPPGPPAPPADAEGAAPPAAMARPDPSLGEALETVDPALAPWSAVARINNSVGGSCSGVLAAPDRVVTAAHCLHNERTGVMLRPEAIHVLVGFARGDYAFHTKARAYRVAPGWDPARTGETVAADLAVIELETPIPATVEPLSFIEEIPPQGTGLIAAGYARQRAYVPTVIRNCGAVGGLAEGRLLAVRCAAAHGYSGGPLLTEEIPARVAGIQIATGRVGARPLTLAIPAPRVAAFLAEE